MPSPDVPVQLILSAGDIGSAVAHRLKRAGYHPVLVEGPAPVVTRRLMSFTDAVHAGHATLEGLEARRCDAAAQALALADAPETIPLLVTEATAEDIADALHPAVWVDARMRKKREPPRQMERAPLVIGIGPGFRVGVHCHVVVESNWGEHLGRVITEGGSEDYTGRHRVVAGKGRERYVYTPATGTFHTDCELLAPVRAGDVVATVDGEPLLAASDGILRGLARSGLHVEAGAKVAEVDPTADPAQCRGIGERPGRIADGVLEAVRRFG